MDGGGVHQDAHWPHCLHYLRQSVLCAADDTIEYPAIINGTRSNLINGAQEYRQCRRASDLFDLRAKYGAAEYRVTHTESVERSTPAL